MATTTLLQLAATVGMLLAQQSLAHPADTLNNRQTPAIPPSLNVTIQRVVYNGNGCPQGSVATSISSDRTTITHTFDKFQVYTGPGIAAAERSRNCKTGVQLSYPSGYQFSVANATYHGIARLDPGVTGRLYSSYMIQEMDVTTNATVTMGYREPLKIFTLSDAVPVDWRRWSPCSGNAILDVGNRVALSSSVVNGEGVLFPDEDYPGIFTHQIVVDWRTC